MGEPIRVAILEDHLGIVDGYRYRLEQTSDVSIVGVATDAEALDRLLAEHPVHVLLLDISVPTSATNSNPYPLFASLASWRARYPHLAVLVVSVYDDRPLIRSVMDAGASGYILKDDWDSIQNLATVIRSIARGGVHFSTVAYHKLHQPRAEEDSLLTARQREALSLCAAYPNATTQELADHLGVQHSTVRNLLSEVYARLGVRNRSAALVKAREMGLVAPFSSK